MESLDKKGITASIAQHYVDPDNVIDLAKKMESGEFKNALMQDPAIRNSVTNMQMAGHHRTLAAEMTGFDLSVVEVPGGNIEGKPWSSVPLKPGRRKK
jgi:hypothetical protein